VPFEFDADKSAANKTKHGIDFVAAQELWKTTTVTVRLPFTEEARRLVIGTINGNHWAAIVTDRGDSVRIISVRRARESEKLIYEEATRKPGY
jgi:uncharacterized DUF497 family protein